MTVLIARMDRLGGVGAGERVDHHKQLHKGGLFNDVMGEAVCRGYLVDIVQKTCLLLLVQRKLVLEMFVPVREAVIQIGLV